MSDLMGSTGQTADTEDTAPQEIRLLQLEEPAEGQETAVIETGLGTITIVLYPEQAPLTVKQFKTLVNEGYYDGKPIFLQADVDALVTGATDETGTEGKVATDDGKPIGIEKSESLWHFSGAVSVLPQEEGVFTKTYATDSRFFILGDIPATTELAEEMQQYEYPEPIIEAYKKRGGMPQFTGNYTVFGQVIDGMDVLADILAAGIDPTTGQPADGTRIESITLSAYHSGDPVDFTFEEYVPPVSSDGASSELDSNAESSAE